MDWLVGRFAEARLPAMADAELERFERLLAVPDPDLQRWILEPSAITESEHRPLIAAMRAFHGLE
jgi:antitoxin CptB